MKLNLLTLCQRGCLLSLSAGWLGAGMLEGGGLKAAAQQVIPLTERSDYVGSCRATGAIAVTLYEDARLTRAVGSVNANTRLTLTGVLGSGTAQIKAPVVGWVQAATLRQCQEGSTPPNPAKPAKGACRRLLDPEFDGPQYADLRNGLVAYNLPGRDPQKVGTEQDGPGKGAIVYFTEPRQIEGKWVRIFYTSLTGSERLGWVSLGVSGRVNFADCLPPGTRRTPLAVPPTSPQP